MTEALLRDAPVAGATARRGRRLPFAPRTALAVAAAAILALAGVAFIMAPKASVTTDAAYVEADRSIAEPKVRGLVAAILVRHNQAVRRGDPLVQIDPEEFVARTAAAKADVETADAKVQSARAALVALGAEEKLAASNVRSAQTAIRSADAQSAKADADRTRYDSLVPSGAVALSEADAVRAAAITARSDADRSRALLDVSRNQAAVTAAKRATLEAAVAQAQAGVARAQAALALARQDQDHTVVRAPIDGEVGDRQVNPGDYVQPGTRLLTLVPMNALYVTANFKETQVSRMIAGQPATIRVDALPGKTLKGEVDSFAPGSGSEFSLLPFEPGTGNFTKIVQRVPVRIRLDPGQDGLDRLRPGLSSTVTVRLTDRGG
jgi:membrane fusion protein (multidrug efflux system)